MAEPLKNLYTPELVAELADALARHYRLFDKPTFMAHVFDMQWPQRELKQRMRHITHSVHAHLPVAYDDQIRILQKAAPAFKGFIAMFFPDFVEVYGLEHPDISIPALELFTQYSSSEFAVRPFIIKYEKRMVKQHMAWTKHANHHVRRLASEGIRPRLPWAMALPQFKQNPTTILPILELLKNDESEYVRRSVANNLNDISKDHPQVVLDIIQKWKGHSKETDWILKHASRGLLKKGHADALQSFGLNHRLKAEVSALQLNRKQVPMGGELSFTFTVTMLEKKSQQVRMEYQIHFVKAGGHTTPKVFQIGTYDMQPDASLTINRKHKFADLTTRKHYAGKHTLVVVINGKAHASADFLLK